MSEYVPDRLSRFSIENFHLGADLAKSNEENIQDEIDDIILSLKNKTLFLVVSTIEPRKQHEEILTAFDTLWNQKNDVALIFVGKQGWMVDDLINKINSHQQLNKNFYWFSSIDDNQLKKFMLPLTVLFAQVKVKDLGYPLLRLHNLNFQLLPGIYLYSEKLPEIQYFILLAVAYKSQMQLKIGFY